jgi:TRAP-type C4-dicarboxylate transport system permease small subunit
MRAVEKFFKILETVINAAVIVFLALMVVNIAGNVILRYVFRVPVSWAEELARYMMIWLSFLGMSLALKDNEHVGLTFFVKLFPKKVEIVLKIISRLVILVFLIFVFINSLDVIPILSRQKSAALRLPMYIPYLSVTVGSVLMMLYVVYQFLFDRTE